MVQDFGVDLLESEGRLGCVFLLLLMHCPIFGEILQGGPKKTVLKEIFLEKLTFFALVPPYGQNRKISKVSNFSKNDMYPLNFMRKSRKSSPIHDLKFLSALKM